MQELRNHASPLDVDMAWHELSQKMQQKKKRRIVLFWFVMAGLAGSVLVTTLLTTTKPLDAFTGTNGINDNGQVEYSMPYHKTLTEIKERPGLAENEVQQQTNWVARGKKMNLGEREVATITAPETMAIEEEMSIKPAAIPAETEVTVYVERDEFKGGTKLLPLLTLVPGCMENEAEQMPLVLVYTQPQNAKTAWWLVAQGGSGVQYFNYRDVRGEAGIIDRVKDIEKPGSVYQGRLGIGHDIGKRYYLSAGLSGLFATEEHTGFVVDTVVGFKENVLISSYKNHDGNVIEEYGNVMTTTVRQTTKKRYPGVSSRSVYLGLGKKWLLGKGMIQLEAAYQQRLFTSMWAEGINSKQEEVDFTQQYKQKSSSWMVDLNYSMPVYRNVWMRAGCLFNQTTLVSPAAYTRYNASLTAQLGLAWALN